MTEDNRTRQFHRGRLTDGWRCFGAHPARSGGQEGWRFCVWAPHALAVSVVGDFNGWEPGASPLRPAGELWEGFLPGLEQYDAYKYAVTGADGAVRMKADPYAFHAETRPGTASKLYDLGAFPWGDGAYCESRAPLYDRPLNIYEVHLGSWRRRENGEFYDYRSLGEELAAYVSDLGYTAVELLPVTEHPLDDSWGYQCTGYFAPTSRFGTPADFQWFVDCLHRKGVAVLLDWVPSHFCKDGHGLYEFDGECCYEYGDVQKREHAAWGTRVFDYGRPEVVSFLLSSARYWLEEYHIDGLRVDAVASMLYLDYDRPAGAWTPNQNGGRENLEAIAFLRSLNEAVFAMNPNALMIAEESTAFPLVTRPVSDGGLGFSFKWNMGWMNDICHYLKLDPWFRQYHHRDLTFSMMYAFTENFVLAISHDEVVHMKGSVVGKLPGDYACQLQSLRGFYLYQLAHPGKKLVFMGEELGQWHEWSFAGELDWALLEREENQKTLDFFRAANWFYREHSALWEIDYDWAGFQWLVPDDNHNNVVVFLRRDRAGRELLCAVNFSPNAYEGYRLGVPARARYVPVFSSDAPAFGGEGFADTAPVLVEEIPSHGRETSVALRIPPFGGVYLEGAGQFAPAVSPAGERPAGRGSARGARPAKSRAEPALPGHGKHPEGKRGGSV